MVADASSNLFKAMHNLRSDRSTTGRNLNDEGALQPDMQRYLRLTRDAELPAMRAAADALATIEFPDHKMLLAGLNRLIEAFATLEAESWDALNKPKAARRPTLGKEFMDNTAALLEALDKLSAKIALAVNHDDPVIDQMLMIKQLAWLMRNTAGEASLLISTGIRPATWRPIFVRTTQDSPAASRSPGRRCRLWRRVRSCRRALSKRWQKRRRLISSRNFSPFAIAS